MGCFHSLVTANVIFAASVAAPAALKPKAGRPRGERAERLREMIWDFSRIQRVRLVRRAGIERWNRAIEASFRLNFNPTIDFGAAGRERSEIEIRSSTWPGTERRKPKAENELENLDYSFYGPLNSMGDFGDAIALFFPERGSPRPHPAVRAAPNVRASARFISFQS